MTVASTLATLPSFFNSHLQLHFKFPMTSCLEKETLGFCMVCTHHLKRDSCRISYFGKALRGSGKGNPLSGQNFEQCSWSFILSDQKYRSILFHGLRLVDWLEDQVLERNMIRKFKEVWG